MSLLKPLPSNERGSDSPIVSCENCTKSLPQHLAMNVIIVVGSPGHPDLAPVQCPLIEHWACGPDCWRVVAHACVDEHMHSHLLQHRQKVGL